MKKTLLCLTTLGVLLLLAGCQSTKGEAEEDYSSTEVTSESDMGISSSTNKADSEITMEDISQKVIDKSFSDDEQHYNVTVQEMVTNIPGKREGENHDGDHFGVAVKVLVASTGKNLSSGFRSDFQLQVGNETINTSSSYYAYFSDYAEEQGWKPLDSTIKSGETKEGWIIFFLDNLDKDKPLSFKCKRPEIPVTVIGGENYTIPAEDFIVEL